MRRHATVLWCCGVLALAACAQEVAPRVEVRTGDAVSQGRAGDGEAQRRDVLMRARSGLSVPSEVSLELAGVVPSPVVDGVTLQATDVTWAGATVFASYNVRGSQYLGALQVIDATDLARPRVRAEAIYRGTDLARVQARGPLVLAAGADVGLGGTLEVWSWAQGFLIHRGSIPVGSYAATYLDIKDYRAAISYGDQGGGVSLWELSGLTPRHLGDADLDDARWAQLMGEEGLVAISGSPSALSMFEGVGQGAPQEEAQLSIQGATVGAPTWASRRGDLLYVSSDDAGLLIYDLADMSLLGQLPTQGNANGSALTLDGRLALLANGEEGLLLVDVLDPSSPLSLASFDIDEDGGSANAVALRGEELALADGLGGVKLLRFTRAADGGPGDCDGDGISDDQDPDDDDDGALDPDDAEPCAPDFACAPGQLEVEGVAFVGDFFNLPCDHPDLEGSVGGVVPGNLPSDYDWYDPKYYAFSVSRDDLLIDIEEDYFPVDQGLCGDPYYFAAHWYTTAIASHAGTYTLEMGSDDDGWLFIDGALVLDLGGIHALVREAVQIELTAGPHRFDIWFAERHVTQSGLSFEVVGTPPGARVEMTQRVCLDPLGDEDGDGVINQLDLAPLVRP
jgi:fibro-slime domain-containing protein